MKTRNKELEEVINRTTDLSIFNTYSDDFDYFENLSKEMILMISYDKEKSVSVWDKHTIISECKDYDIMKSLKCNDNIGRINTGSKVILKDENNYTKVIIVKLDTARDTYNQLLNSLKQNKL